MQNKNLRSGRFLIFLLFTENCLGYPTSAGIEQSHVSPNQPGTQYQPPQAQYQQQIPTMYSNPQQSQIQSHQQPPLTQPHQQPPPMQQSQQPQLIQHHQSSPGQPHLQSMTSPTHQQSLPVQPNQASMPLEIKQQQIPSHEQQPPMPSQVHQPPMPAQAYQHPMPSRSALSLQPKLAKMPSFSSQNTSQPHQKQTTQMFSQPHHFEHDDPHQQQVDQKSALRNHKQSRPQKHHDQQSQRTELQQQPKHIPTPPPVPIHNNQLSQPKPKTDFGYSTQFGYASDTIDSVPIPYMKYDKDESPVLHYGHDDLDEEYGDRRVLEGEFPYFVQLRTKNKLFCGAALIRSPITGRQVIITALHCLVEPGTSKVYSPEVLTLRMGVIGVNDNGQERNVQAILAHPGYILFGPSKRPIFDDIGLVIPDAEFTLNKHVQTVDLPGINLPTKWHEIIIKGFGKGREAGHMDVTKYMRTISVPVWENAACNKAYFEESGANLITEDHFCAGSRTGGLDSCQGDSGGPATTMEKGKMYLVGVVSWGKGCGKKAYPGVYARVWSYRNWIKMTLFDYEINGVLPPLPKYPQ